MTNFSDTVQSILEIISDLRGETTTNTDTKRIRAISRSETAISKQVGGNIFYLPDQTITSTGASTYTIGSATFPMSNKGLVEVFVNGTTEDCRYKITDSELFKEEYNENNSEKLCYVSYNPTTDDWSLTISPTPEVGVTITYSYYWIPPKRTSVSDSVYCLNMEALARQSLAEIYDSEDEDDKAAIERNKAQQLLSTEQETESAPSPSQNYSMGDDGMGFGTY